MQTNTTLVNIAVLLLLTNSWSRQLYKLRELSIDTNILWIMVQYGFIPNSSNIKALVFFSSRSGLIQQIYDQKFRISFIIFFSSIGYLGLYYSICVWIVQLKKERKKLSKVESFVLLNWKQHQTDWYQIIFRNGAQHFRDFFEKYFSVFVAFIHMASVEHIIILKFY